MNQTTEPQAFRTLRLSNGRLEVLAMPELGGKLASLRDLHSGREWLWRSDRLADKRHSYGTSYITEADTGGWDECFPTVAACPDPAGGLDWPDHGELWSQAWENQQDDLSLHTVAHGVQHPYRFERTLRLHPEEARLELHYRVRNEGNKPLDYIWSSHPLFRLEPGMRLKFPLSARFRLFYKPDDTHLEGSEPYTWPLTANDLDLSSLPGPEAGIAIKIWSEPQTEGWAELVASQGRLRFEFNPLEVPQLGLWLNLGGWTGTGGPPYYNLALEPCIGAQDSLFEAVQTHHLYRTLRPAEEATWALTLRLLP
jgi:galactose mutarotase-like enzyme